MTHLTGKIDVDEFVIMEREMRSKKLLMKLQEVLSDIGNIKFDLKHRQPYMLLPNVFNSDEQLIFLLSSRGFGNSNNVVVIRMRNIGDRRNSYWVDLEKLLSGDDETLQKLRKIVSVVIEHRQIIRCKQQSRLKEEKDERT